MRHAKKIILVIVLMAILQGNLFSLITSRIEVSVIDEDTGEPIPGAEIRVFRMMDDVFKPVLRGETNAEGFDNLNVRFNGNYLLNIIKEGYAVFGPFSEEFLEEYKLKAPFGASTIEASGLDYFSLDEGEIKHVRVKMQKEAKLVVNLQKKYPHGVFPVEGLEGGASIYNEDYYYPYVKEFKNLKTGIVTVELGLDGFMGKSIENVVLRKGETTTINYTFDFTKGQVIHGRIIEKNTELPLVGVRVKIIDDEGFGIFPYATTNTKGEYWLGGIEPGLYRIWFRSIKYKKEIDHMETIRININQKIEISKEFIVW